MTNTEIALDKVSDLINDCNDGEYVKGTECDCLQYPCRLITTYEVIKENVKLKEDIERLSKINGNLVRENDKQNAEIKQLKLELGQREDLPCKIGDTVYVTVPFNKPKHINVRTVEGFRLIKGEIFVETNSFSHHISDFGRVVFLNRSVAELKLLEL